MTTNFADELRRTRDARRCASDVGPTSEPSQEEVHLYVEKVKKQSLENVNAGAGNASVALDKIRANPTLPVTRAPCLAIESELRKEGFGFAFCHDLICGHADCETESHFGYIVWW